MGTMKSALRMFIVHPLNNGNNENGDGPHPGAMKLPIVFFIDNGKNEKQSLFLH